MTNKQKLHEFFLLYVVAYGAYPYVYDAVGDRGIFAAIAVAGPFMRYDLVVRMMTPLFNKFFKRITQTDKDVLTPQNSDPVQPNKNKDDKDGN